MTTKGGYNSRRELETAVQESYFLKGFVITKIARIECISRSTVAYIIDATYPDRISELRQRRIV